MTKQTARIDNWRIREWAGKHYLVGRVSEHPMQNSFISQLQNTSDLLSIDEDKGIAETVNTLYTLGSKHNG